MMTAFYFYLCLALLDPYYDRGGLKPNGEFSGRESFDYEYFYKKVFILTWGSLIRKLFVVEPWASAQSFPPPIYPPLRYTRFGC